MNGIIEMSSHYIRDKEITLKAPVLAESAVMSEATVEKQVRSELDRIDERQPRERIPFGVPQAKHGVLYEIPGFFLRLVDDRDGRLERALEGGYQFVHKSEVRLSSTHDMNGDLGERVSKVVGSNKQTGAGYRSYLMKLPNELREEDVRILSDRRAKRMDGIKNGPTDKNFYSPVKNSFSSSSTLKD